MAQAPHRAKPAAHRLGRGRHALEWKCLPCRQQLDCVGAQERRQIVHELLGLSAVAVATSTVGDVLSSARAASTTDAPILGRDDGIVDTE